MLVAVLPYIMTETRIPVTEDYKVTQFSMLNFAGVYVWNTLQTLQFPDAFNSVRDLL